MRLVVSCTLALTVLLAAAFGSVSASNQAGVYTHLGCFLDKRKRDLPHYQGNRKTLQSCGRICSDKNYSAFGLQYGGQCFCGNEPGKYGTKPARDCRTRCSARRSEYCGGTWRNSIYRTGIDHPVALNGFGYLGCYRDTSRRDLSHLASRRTTREGCRRMCSSRGSLYYSLQWYGQCFCGNKYGSYGKADENECNKRCKNRDSEICGGFWRNSVFTTDVPYSMEERTFQYLGCYVDKRNRDLKHYLGSGRTAATCGQQCKSRGYRYFGTQYYGQCFCGRNRPSYSKKSNAECNTRCRKNQGEFCGGTWRNSVYKI